MRLVQPQGYEEGERRAANLRVDAQERAGVVGVLHVEAIRVGVELARHVGLLRVGRAVAPFADVGRVRCVPRERVVVGLGLVLVEDLAHARRPPAVPLEVLRQRNPRVASGGVPKVVLEIPYLCDVGQPARQEGVARGRAVGVIGVGALEDHSFRR